MYCYRCNTEKEEKDFFVMKNNQRYHVCKDCLTKNFDVTNKKQIFEILKIFDVPYVESIWIDCIAKTLNALRDDKNALGKYLRIMNMFGYRWFTFKDTNKIKRNEERWVKENALWNDNLYEMR